MYERSFSIAPTRRIVNRAPTLASGQGLEANLEFLGLLLCVHLGQCLDLRVLGLRLLFGWIHMRDPPPVVLSLGQHPQHESTPWGHCWMFPEQLLEQEPTSLGRYWMWLLCRTPPLLHNEQSDIFKARQVV